MFNILKFILVLVYVCKPHGKPKPAYDDVCVFWCSSLVGFPINNYLYNSNISYSIHGFWPKVLYKPLVAISYQSFLLQPKLINGFNYTFLDSTNFSLKLGCGHYREYSKHAAHSGYSFNYWLDKINNCNPEFAVFPHQCSFNGTHNLVLSATSVNIGQVGCVVGYSYINTCND